MLPFGCRSRRQAIGVGFISGEIRSTSRSLRLSTRCFRAIPHIWSSARACTRGEGAPCSPRRVSHLSRAAFAIGFAYSSDRYVACKVFLAAAHSLQLEHPLQLEQALGLLPARGFASSRSPVSQQPPRLFFLKNVALIARASTPTTTIRMIQLARFIFHRFQNRRGV